MLMDSEAGPTVLADGRTNATRVLAAYAADLRDDDLPTAILDHAKLILCDTLGCMIGGSGHPHVLSALRAVTPWSLGPCTVAGHDRTADPQAAAFSNAIAVHSTDLDDSHAPSRTHPAAVVIPAALAAAETVGDCSGSSLLAGIIVGYDVTARLGKAMGVRAPFDRGFHSASVCGAVGAAVAAGRILRLPEAGLVSCIALAASQSSGLTTYEDDATHAIKSVQMGVGARNGVSAALLAAAGMLVTSDVLTGANEMLSAFSPQVDTSHLVTGLGQQFDIQDTSLKRHACCGQAHAAIDALLLLRESVGLRAHEITEIEVELSHDAFAMLNETSLMTHNIKFVLSVAAIEGRVAMEHFLPGWMNRDLARTLMAKVNAYGTDALQGLLPRHKGAVVTLHTASGPHRQYVAAPRGNPDDPLSNEELRDKFLFLAGQGSLANDQGIELWNLVAQLEDAATLAPMMEIVGISRPLE